MQDGCMRRFVSFLVSQNMHLLLLLIASSFFPFICAGSQVAQDLEKQPHTTIILDTLAKWTEIISLFNPANAADKIQDLLDVPLTESSDGAQPETHFPPNFLDDRPVLGQQSLEAFLADETTKIIRSLETVINDATTLGVILYDVLGSASSDGASPSSVSLNPLLKKLVDLIMIACDDFRSRFPLPKTALGHAERIKNVSEALERLRRLVIRLAESYGTEREVIEHHLTLAMPLLHHMGVLIGDVVELYPAVVEALVLNLSAVLLPEAVFLRSLVILYCLGPYVLGRDAIGGWLLKHISEAVRGG